MKNHYEPVMGLEIHVQLKTKSKMFCGCSTDYRNDPPNTHCCPVCLGLPGALPVPNKKAIEQVILMGLALNCQINKNSYFARKNYFYPDLPKGYQITQYDKPFCHSGKLKVKSQKLKIDREIGITRIHLEEDTGKSIHENDYTLLDFNKSGIPLMELVTEPEFHTAEEVFVFAKKIRQIVRYLDISDGDMEKGMLRVEPNISLRQVQSLKFKVQSDNSKLKISKEELPKYKVEIKNLNSFSSLKRGVEFEIKRQTELLDKGQTPKQETRGWDDTKQSTFSQRSKEEAHDYRYFPEPDIPPIEVEETKKQGNKETVVGADCDASSDGIFLDKLQKQLPELPDAKAERFVKDYGVTEYDTQVLTEEKEVADWFEDAVNGLSNKGLAKKVANWVITDIMGRISNDQFLISKQITNSNDSNREQKENGIWKLKIKPEQLGQIVSLVDSGQISRDSGKEVLAEVLKKGGEVNQIVKEKGLKKVTDAGQLEKVVQKIMVANPKPVSDFRSGKKSALQFLLGQVMRETKGKADVKVLNEIMVKLLND